MTPLHQHIISLIDTHGDLSFHDYMELALYHPDHGYYASAKQRVGKQGDFITSISVGKCFGIILAQRITKYWYEIGSPEDFHIIEPGAHDGSLCADILDEIKSSSPALYSTVHYHLIERSSSLRKAQGEKLHSCFQEKFTSHNSLSEIENLTGIFLSNELLDAFPIELIRVQNSAWQQLFVTHHDGNLEYVAKKIVHPALENFCHTLNDKLGTNFPDGYTTEYNPHIDEFTTQVSRALKSGLFITIDYGHESTDLYHPARTEGTLQTYSKHQKASDPLSDPGNFDITTHIDFTRLTTSAQEAGFSLKSFSMQASYLTQHGRDWLMSLESSPSPETTTLLRQFQSLTHPSMLGTKFMVLEMER
ncbi:MAG: class I SAM-dependent methyltransferase [Akkermansiaceae bacterium]